MNRRAFLMGTAAAMAAPLMKAAPPASPFGVCIYSFGAARKFADTIEFLDHCHDLGAAGIQMHLTSLDTAYAEKVRAKAEQYGMYYEGIVTLPKGDTTEFEAQIKAAKAAGAKVVRSACLGTRRYETFHDLAAWQQFRQASIESIHHAVPILEQQKIGLAIENHKDWTVDEMVEAFQTRPMEYLGLCLDFGNNIALLDAPDAVAQLAPWALATHVKDIAVEPDKDGFRMSEVPLGEGVVNVHKLVAAVKAARPTTRFSLEMITRDPLRIPCLTEDYWATFPDRSGVFLARTLAMVRAQSGRLQGLAEPSKQSQEAQTRLADDNLKLCLNYAREQFAS